MTEKEMSFWSMWGPPENQHVRKCNSVCVAICWIQARFWKGWSGIRSPQFRAVPKRECAFLWTTLKPILEYSAMMSAVETTPALLYSMGTRDTIPPKVKSFAWRAHRDFGALAFTSSNFFSNSFFVYNLKIAVPSFVPGLNGHWAGFSNQISVAAATATGCVNTWD